MELSVNKETIVVEEIKEVGLRSLYALFIYDVNDDRIRLQRRGHAPSRLPVKKLMNVGLTQGGLIPKQHSLYKAFKTASANTNLT